MASTPEAKVKAQVKRALKTLQDKGYPVYYHMPVQNGMGKPTLDFVGCIKGQFFAIETKAPGKKPTERQEATIMEMHKAGAHVIVYDGTNPEVLAGWLAMLS
jgi:hypothetical protein